VSEAPEEPPPVVVRRLMATVTGIPEADGRPPAWNQLLSRAVRSALVETNGAPVLSLGVTPEVPKVGEWIRLSSQGTWDPEGDPYTLDVRVWHTNESAWGARLPWVTELGRAEEAPPDVAVEARTDGSGAWSFLPDEAGTYRVELGATGAGSAGAREALIYVRARRPVFVSIHPTVAAAPWRPRDRYAGGGDIYVLMPFANEEILPEAERSPTIRVELGGGVSTLGTRDGAASAVRMSPHAGVRFMAGNSGQGSFPVSLGWGTDIGATLPGFAGTVDLYNLGYIELEYADAFTRTLPFQRDVDPRVVLVGEPRPWGFRLSVRAGSLLLGARDEDHLAWYPFVSAGVALH
jgi:hypothetical protein